MFTVDSVLQFWFGKAVEDAEKIGGQTQLWFRKSAQTDQTIATRFGQMVAAAAQGDLDFWGGTPRGRLALIVILDQFTRNIYRDTPAAFACDARALALALEGIEQGWDGQLAPIQRVFFYLPLEHAENLDHQEQCVALFQDLAEAVPPIQKPHFQSFATYAVKHRDVIARFGRFPHRNDILGRVSTGEEAVFLKQPGSRF